MSFDFRFGPPQFVLFPEGDARLVTAMNRPTACFSVANFAGYFQTDSVTIGVRIMTPQLIPPFNGVNIFATSTARGRVEAVALNGFAQARVEARLKVLDSRLNPLIETDPVLFGGSSIFIPWFNGFGFDFGGTAMTSGRLTRVGTSPLIVEARISSGVGAFGPAYAIANISNACFTSIRVVSF